MNKHQRSVAVLTACLTVIVGAGTINIAQASKPYEVIASINGIGQVIHPKVSLTPIGNDLIVNEIVTDIRIGGIRAANGAVVHVWDANPHATARRIVGSHHLGAVPNSR